MPDITMCNDEKCPKRKECYSFMAIPSEYRQSYFAKSPRKNDKCEYFYPIQKWHKLNDKILSDDKSVAETKM